MLLGTSDIAGLYFLHLLMPLSFLSYCKKRRNKGKIRTSSTSTYSRTNTYFLEVADPRVLLRGVFGGLVEVRDDGNAIFDVASVAVDGGAERVRAGGGKTVGGLLLMFNPLVFLGLCCMRKEGKCLTA